MRVCRRYRRSSRSYPDVDQLIEQSSKEQSYSDEDDENLDGDSDVDIIHADSD